MRPRAFQPRGALPIGQFCGVARRFRALDVENILDDRSLINFGSDFSGTKFQQGRRVILSANLGF